MAGHPLPLLSRLEAFRSSDGGTEPNLTPGLLESQVNMIEGEFCLSPDDVPYLGVTYMPITETFARYYGLGIAGGTLVTAVARNSPAARAGIQPDDILLSINGEPITLDNPMVSILLLYRSGDSLALTVLRGHEQREVEMILGRRPEN